MKKFCVCRSTDGAGFMIQCEKCEEWFHGRCIQLKKKDANHILSFFCQACMADDPSIKIQYKPGYVPPESKPQPVKQEPLEERKQEKILEKSQSSSAQPKSKSKPASKAQPKVVQTKRKAGTKTKSKGHNRLQCANPECIHEARADSKYCSHDCGYAFNKLRYETFFIPKWKALEGNHSAARKRKLEDIFKLENEKTEVIQTIKNLKLDKEKLESTIQEIKDHAKRLCKENATSKEKAEDDAEMDSDEVEETTSGDASKSFCITCGLTVPMARAFQHWSTCHKKHEASYAFTGDVPLKYSSEGDEDPKIYCHVQDKKTKRYCMQLESSCPQHSNWQSDKDEVCGCPLDVMQDLVADGNYCLELKRDCTLHYQWDKFRLAQMNMQRAQAFGRLDVICDRIRMLMANYDDTYGGVVGVMLHDTINHLNESPAQTSGPSPEQEEVDVDMTGD